MQMKTKIREHNNARNILKSFSSATLIYFPSYKEAD